MPTCRTITAIRWSDSAIRLRLVEGKVAASVTELHAGDIGAVAKLKNTFTGDTLGDKAQPLFYEPAILPEPAIAFAVEPRTRADEEQVTATAVSTG